MTTQNTMLFFNCFDASAAELGLGTRDYSRVSTLDAMFGVPIVTQNPNISLELAIYTYSSFYQKL